MWLHKLLPCPEFPHAIAWYHSWEFFSQASLQILQVLCDSRVKHLFGQASDRQSHYTIFSCTMIRVLN